MLLQNLYLQLAGILLQKGILEFFELNQVLQNGAGVHICLSARNEYCSPGIPKTKAGVKRLLPEAGIKIFLSGAGK